MTNHQHSPLTFSRFCILEICEVLRWISYTLLNSLSWHCSNYITNRIQLFWKKIKLKHKRMHKQTKLSGRAKVLRRPLVSQLVHHPRPWKRGKRVYFRHEARYKFRVSKMAKIREKKGSVLGLGILKKGVKKMLLEVTTPHIFVLSVKLGSKSKILA